MSPADLDSAYYDVEYRAIPDDAWYSVHTSFDGQNLTVKYQNFPDDDNSIFRPQDFNSLQEIEDFKGRFRPISSQVQDSECKSLAEGTVVCASCCFTELDVRFYDAFVDDVTHRDHSFTNGQEQCMCDFVVVWKHGPVAGCLANRKIENICHPQSTASDDPNIASFLELARKKLQTATCNTLHEHNASLSAVKPQSIVTPRFNNGTNCTRLPVTSKWKSQETERMVNYSERIKEETDVGGDANQYFVIENLDKDLSPSAIVEFIRSQTSVLVQAYVFPSLPLETCTKGIIALECPKDFQKLCELLDSPNHIVVSSRGRPWVMTKKMSVMPFGIVMTKYQEGKSNEIGRVKVVHSGSEEHKIAKQLKDMFVEFVEHQEGLHRTLALEEKKILQQNLVR